MRPGNWGKWGEFEIDRTPNEPSGDHDLIIDGVLVEQKHAAVQSHRHMFIFWLRDHTLLQKFLRHSIIDLPPIEYLHSSFECGDTPITALAFSSQEPKLPRPHSYKTIFEAEPDLSKWTKPYSFAKYCDQLSQHLKTLKTDVEFQTAQDENKLLQVSSFWITFSLSTPALPLINEVNRRIETLRIIHEEIETVLLPGSKSTAVAVAFDFPEPVRIPCEQYLVYFVEFLRELGVEATSDLRHEAGKVLFTITPRDPLEALDNIRLALEIYLRLPSSPFDATAAYNDVTTQKLLANIHHLTGQLALARALVETKNATIQTQQLAMDMATLGVEVVAESVVDVTPPPKKSDKEEFLGGTFAVTKYQGKGFEINIPELIRLLRRRFGKSN